MEETAPKRPKMDLDYALMAYSNANAKARGGQPNAITVSEREATQWLYHEGYLTSLPGWL